MQTFQVGQTVLYTCPNFKGFASNVLATVISYMLKTKSFIQTIHTISPVISSI